ncbi:MAG: hypothetical protein ACYC9M_04715 [Desulfobulbaceae bacterium]
MVTGNPGIGRYLFGVPWLLFGLHFYYKYLVLGIAEYIKAGDIAGIFTGVLGWLFIVLFGAVFVVPGWLLVFLRRRVVVDVGRGMVDEMNDYLLFRRGKSQRLGVFGAVLLAATSHKGRVTTYMHEVRLMPRREGEPVLAAIMQDEEEGQQLGTAIADLLNLPFSARPGAEEETDE